MRLIMTAALALCLSTPAWADAPPNKSKSAPSPARLEALAPATEAASDPLRLQRQVLADLNRDIENRLQARLVAAN